IVGANPQPSIRRYESDAVHIHANVPDIEQYYHRSAVFLHPHAGASGIQNKVLQAMAMGCPVVTTPTGLQGNPARHGKEVFVGRTDAELAHHCITLLRDPALRSRVARDARALVERTLAREVIFRQLDDIVEEVRNKPNKSVG